MKVCEIGRRDIMEVLQAVAVASGPTSANRVRAHLSAAWTWALRAGECEGDNPVAFTPKPATERARDRVLSDKELALIWRCTGAASDYERIVRLLMLTAARREEVGGMAWAEVRLSGGGRGVWTIRSARSKNGREHELPLTALAVAQLPPAGERALLFGREDETSFSGWSAAKARLDLAMGRELARQFREREGRDPAPCEVALKPWRLHDLRRTFATWSNEHGIAPHIVEAVLNHVSGARAGVAGVYNHAAYREQKGAALNAWSAHVSGLTSKDIAIAGAA
jgi:integrase